MLTFPIRLSRQRTAGTGSPAILLLCCGLLLAIAAPHRRAIGADAPAASAPAAPANDIADKRAKIAERIAKLSAPANAAPAKGQPDPTVPAAEDELDLLESLDLVYIQQQAASDDRASLEQEKKKLTEETESLHNQGPAEPKPYSFRLLEDIRDQRGAEDDRAESIHTNLTSAQDMLQTARENYEECERQRRAANEAVQDNKDAGQQPALAHVLQLAELKSSVANETVVLRRAEIDVATGREALDKLRRDYLQEKIAIISKGVKFTEADLQTRIQSMNKSRNECRLRLKAAQKSLQRHETEEQKTLADLQQKHANASIVDAATEAYQLARRAHCEEIALINQQLVEMEHFRHLLTCRYELVNGKASKESIALWETQVTEILTQRKSQQTSRGLRLREIHVDQSTLLRRSHVDQDDQIKPWIEMQTRHLQRLGELYETNLLQLQTGQRSLQRYIEDLQANSPPKTAADRLAAVRQAFSAFWNYELASVDDRPVTIGKIASGVFYLLVGLLLARLVSGVFGRQILPRLGLNEGATHAVQSIMFYALCVLFCLVSLELVNLPFAAFTCLGGAAAIGIGFGSQNIVNNFISGLILLAEQPLRVGDLVDIDGRRGTVERIGAQSTRVRTVENHEIVVPNSKLLEDKVTNLTLTDNLVRTTISVTLAVGLPVAEVRRRLLHTVSRHAKVLAEPAPLVLFLSSSKTELNLELHFWVRMSNLMDARIVESEIREAINLVLEETSAAATAAASAANPSAVPAVSVGPATMGSPPGTRPADPSIAGKVAPDRPSAGRMPGAAGPQQRTLRKAG